MLAVRFARTGRVGQRNFRIVLMDKKTSPKGRAMQVLGHYQPFLKGKTLVFEKEAILDWIKKGAKPSPSVASVLKKQGVPGMDRFIIMKQRKRAKKGEEGAKKEEAPSSPPAEPKA